MCKNDSTAERYRRIEEFAAYLRDPPETTSVAKLDALRADLVRDALLLVCPDRAAKLLAEVHILPAVPAVPIRCHECQRPVSTPVPASTVVLAEVVCLDCADRQAKSTDGGGG